MDAEQVLARLEQMFQRVVENHEARLRALEKKNDLRTSVVSAIASVLVALIAAAVAH